MSINYSNTLAVSVLIEMLAEPGIFSPQEFAAKAAAADLKAAQQAQQRRSGAGQAKIPVRSDHNFRPCGGRPR